MTVELTIRPECRQWKGLTFSQPTGALIGCTLDAWRVRTREELGLATDTPMIATGHQALLWHPGILAKYMVVDSFAHAHGMATANLIVDQHAEGWGEYAVPVRRDDGALAARAVELCRPRPRKDVPMGFHEGFTPPRPPKHLSLAMESMELCVQRITDAVYAEREAPNAAIQMARAIERLMREWVRPMPMVTSAALIRTELSRRLLERMVEDPQRCAESYNRAVAAVPEAGINPLLIRDDYVELPLWRIREDGRRMHAYDADVDRALRSGRELAPLSAGGAGEMQHTPPVAERRSGAWLLPRALFMTALVRMGMCDLFVHGHGGATYDVAMEHWIKDWLGVKVGAMAMVSATLRLPLQVSEPGTVSVEEATRATRRLWHDPNLVHGSADPGPSPTKQAMLQAMAAAPRRSAERRQHWLDMHIHLEQQRQARAAELAQAAGREAWARRQAGDRMIASRRDWAFPLYPGTMLDELWREAERRVSESSAG